MSGYSKNSKRGHVNSLARLGSSELWAKSDKRSALLLISRPCLAPLLVTPYNFLELTAELSTSTTRPRKSFIIGLAIVWKRNWSKPFAQLRYDSGRALPGGRPPPELPFKS